MTECSSSSGSALVGGAATSEIVTDTLLQEPNLATMRANCPGVGHRNRRLAPK